MATLIITVRNDNADMSLAGLPLFDGQYIVGETPGAETTEVEVELADRADTTATQEQFLNTSEAVVSYKVR